MLKGSVQGIFKPSVGFGKEETPVWVQAERRDIPQPGSVKRKNRLKTRFLHKHKRQGIAKGEIQTLARVADVKNTSQSSQRGLKRTFLFQKKHSRLNCGTPHHGLCLEHPAALGTHHFSQPECHFNNNYSLSSSINFYQKR